ncbi:MAG: ABC transporter permease subunit [Legionellales bacterium]|nr:ABC transporter permease subunit [Legionellales bacterium]
MAAYSLYKKTALCFIMPQILITLGFFIWPSSQAIFQSLFFSDAFGLQHRFAGLRHFIDLWQNSDYGMAVWVTLTTSVAITLLTMVFGLAMALLVNARKKSQPIYQSLLLWPYAVAPAVAAILWRFLCHPTLGWITGVLQWFGVDFNYLIHPTQALWVVVITASWQQFSYDFLFYFAALKLIPKSLMEAAIMDGASSTRRFFHIVLPLLSPTTFFLLTMNLIYAFFDTFGIIQVMTHGGPGNSTTNLVYKVYKDGFVGMDLGSSSAQSVMLMLMVIALTLFQFRFLEKKVHYQ